MSLQDCCVMLKQHRRFHQHVQQQTPPQCCGPLRTNQDCPDLLVPYLPDHLWKERNRRKQIGHRIPRGEQSVLSHCLLIPVPRHIPWELGRILASESIQSWLKTEVIQNGPEHSPVQHEHPLGHIVSQKEVCCCVFFRRNPLRRKESNIP